MSNAGGRDNIARMLPEAIPCAVMRGGTSKGVYFVLDDLPAEETARNNLLLKLMGGDKRQTDGIGGGDMLNSKVAMVSKAANADVDVDYRFAQVVPGGGVDTSPTCGNILAGVGAFALERGLIATKPGNQERRIVVRDINTGAKVEQLVRTTADGKPRYDGDCVIAGAPGAAAPVRLFYLEFAGAKTGKLFPTGARTDLFDGIAATCIDAAMPTVIAAAADFGIGGYEDRDSLQNNKALFEKMEAVRLQAAKKMTLGDARGAVIPKFAMVAPPAAGGALAGRYFTPVSAHAAFAVSGGIAVACAAMMDGTTAAKAACRPAAGDGGVFAVDIEHPSGIMQVLAEFDNAQKREMPIRAGTTRTTRLIMTGKVFPPQ
ncbi:MAG: PrpF domain-containing protein [Gammaproteobacteria bacterium]